jgi:hypothetical protein
MTREQIVILAKINKARTQLANKYGNLYGMRLRDWFVFNGEIAVFKGKDRDTREAMRLRFEERLTGHRNSRGTSAVHRARRALLVS